MRSPILALVLLTLLLAPPSVAQIPSTQTCGPFLLTVATPQPAPAGGASQVTVTVTNNGNLGAGIVVSASTTTPGWSLAETTRNVTVGASGGTGTAIFTMRASEDATEGGVVSFAGDATCSPPAGLPCSVCTAQTPAGSTTVPVEPEQGFRIPGLSGLGLPLEMVIVATVLLGAAVLIPLLLRKKRPVGAMVGVPEPLKRLRPGKGASFPLEMKNPMNAPTRLALSVGAVPEGWSAFLPLPEIQLAANESRSVWLMVRAPPSARGGDSVVVEITATDPGAPDRPKTVRVKAEVDEAAPES